MKYFLTILFLYTGLNNYAQSEKKPNRAIFKECKSDSLSSRCTKNKLRADIIALMTAEFSHDIKTNHNADYLSVSAIILIDENGKIVPEETDIKCNYKPLKNAIKQYLANLPDFYPADKNLTERRSVYIISETFVYSNYIREFVAVNPTDLKALGIKPDYLGPDTEPSLKKPRKDGKNGILDIVNERFKKVSFYKTDGDFKIIKIAINISCDEFGVLNIEKIEAENHSFDERIRKAFKKLPDFLPATVRGIPVATTWRAPVTIKLE